jgi:hypothetical protein
MANKAPDKVPPGPQLDALTAEKVFGWQKVHKHEGALVGKKPDKFGHWRRAKMPNYPLHSYSVENRMKQLGRFDSRFPFFWFSHLLIDAHTSSSAVHTNNAML